MKEKKMKNKKEEVSRGKCRGGGGGGGGERGNENRKGIIPR